jgi:hypothetical protein
MTQQWNNSLEKEFKETIKNYFDGKINEYLKNTDNCIEVGNKLGYILKSSEEDIVKIVTPRAVKKWASAETLPLWEEFLKNERMISELREIRNYPAMMIPQVAERLLSKYADNAELLFDPYCGTVHLY